MPSSMIVCCFMSFSYWRWSISMIFPQDGWGWCFIALGSGGSHDNIIFCCCFDTSRTQGWPPLIPRPAHCYTIAEVCAHGPLQQTSLGKHLPWELKDLDSCWHDTNKISWCKAVTLFWGNGGWNGKIHPFVSIKWWWFKSERGQWTMMCD